MARSPKKPLRVEALTHDEASRKNAPTAELETFVDDATRRPIAVAYERRNRDLDPQLVWRGKDVADWSDLVVEAPPLYIQEKIHPKALIEDLKRASARTADYDSAAPDLFADFNGIEPDQRTEFYAHDQHWSNRMILGDALKVMASLAEREGLKGQVQCIYIDPPYGIKFNSNFQWSITSRDVKDGKADHLTREPEQVKAFRDTWADGIHSYLTYLRDRLTVARDLLTESGSVFVQIGDENVHRVRALMDEVFGDENFLGLIAISKGATGLSASGRLAARLDYIVWYAKSASDVKYRQLYTLKSAEEDPNFNWVINSKGQRYRRNEYEGLFGKLSPDLRFGQDVSLTKPGPGAKYKVDYHGRSFVPGKRWWGTTKEQLERALKTDRIIVVGNSLRHLRFLDESSLTAIGNLWDGFLGQSNPVYVVQTNTDLVARCILMTTDPGDLVLDPTCGSGTTAYVAEQWGRRWITIDTSRVALALARARIMGARYPWYLLADSREGQAKEAEITRTPPRDTPTQGRVRQGFVYKRVPHITLKSIANNAEIDTIWEEYQAKLEPLRKAINEARGRTPSLRGAEGDAAIHGGSSAPQAAGNGSPRASGARDDEGENALPPFEEWTMPREPGAPWPEDAAKALEKARSESASEATRTKWLAKLNEALGRDYTLVTLPEHPVDPWPDTELPPEAAQSLDWLTLPLETDAERGPRTLHEAHAEWWRLRIERQREIDASIAAKADTEYLYDQPYEDRSRVRVAGPFTVESLSPHRVPAMDVDDSLFDELEAAEGRRTPESSGESADFAQMVLDNLQRSGVQQSNREDRLVFESLKLWPGRWIVAEGQVRQASMDEKAGGDDADSDSALGAEGPSAEGGKPDRAPGGQPAPAEASAASENKRRAAVFVGPEYGTVARADLTAAAREAMEAGFDLLIAAAFNFDAHAGELTRMGPLAVLHARINPDLHMPDLANTGAGNLFTVFGEPDIVVHDEGDGPDGQGRVSIEVIGVDMYKGGQIESGDADDIAVWFLDTDYNYESFFVRHAYFPGANDPYKALKTTLKAEIDADAWESLNRVRSRPFARPKEGRVAVKVVNHLGDEVMKVLEV